MKKYILETIEDRELIHVLLDFAAAQNLKKTGDILSISAGSYFINTYETTVMRLIEDEGDKS